MRFLLRTDVGPSVGSGHVMRSTTLAEALMRQGHHVDLLLPDALPEFVAERLGRTDVAVQSGTGFLDRAAEALNGLRPDVVVVDGYELADQVGEFVAAGCPVAVIDDNAEIAVSGVRCVVNQNLHAESIDYSAVADAELLLGPSYALLRPDVVGLSSQRDRTNSLDVLIAVGGTDPRNLTVPVAEALDGLTTSVLGRVTVALGADHPDRARLDNLVNRADGRLKLADSSLVECLSTVGLAVVGAGSTLWEVAHLGLPAVALIVAENQVKGSSSAAEHGLVTAVDCRGSSPIEGIVDALSDLAADDATRDRMSRKGRRLFDGRGAERVALCLESIAT